MSGSWKPTNNPGQKLAQQIEERGAEAGPLKSKSRYQPIAPYGGISAVNTNQRRHTGRACDECKRKKIKCFSIAGSASCKNCISHQKGCTYDIGVKIRGPQRGRIKVLENRLKRIEGLIDTMSSNSDQQKITAASLKSITSPTNCSSEDFNSSDKAEETDNGNNGKKQKVIERREQASNTLYKEAVNEPKSMLDAVRPSHIIPPEGRFFSGNSMRYLFLSKNIQSMSESELSRYGVEIQHNNASNDYFLKRRRTLDDRRRDQIDHLIELGVIRSTVVIQNMDDWIWRVAGINKDLSDRLLKVYFAYIHPLMPVVNKVAFLQQYRGIDAVYPAGPLLNAIYGAVIRYIENCKRFGDEDTLDDGGPWDFPDNLASVLFQNLIVFIKGKYTPCLSTIQAIVIAHNNSANVENWASGWLLNCIAVRMSQDIGLHISSDGWDITQQEKETRRMVWWQVYLLDRWFSAGTGRPLTAFDEDCDELYPTENVNLDEIMDTMTEKDRHLPRFPSLDAKIVAKATDSKIPMNQPFIQLLRLSEILGRILQGLYTPKAKKHSAQHGSDAIVGYLDDALSKWRASLPPLLEISSSAGTRSSVTEKYVPLLSMSGLLNLSYCTLLILLHRPFIENNGSSSAAQLAAVAATTTPGSSNFSTDNTTKSNKQKLSAQSSLTICTSAAIRIVELSENMHYRDFFMVSWGFALYPVFTAALIHIYNATHSDTIISDVAKSNLVRALHVVDKLCLLSPMAAGMGNILKRIVSLSSIFENDPGFIAALNIKKQSEEFSSFTMNKANTTAEEDDKNQEEHEENLSPTATSRDINNKPNSASPMIDVSTNPPVAVMKKKNTVPTKAGDETQRKIGIRKTRLADWTVADDDTVRSQWRSDYQNEEGQHHVNKKKRAVDITSPSWEDGEWLNQLYTPTQPNFDLTKEDNYNITVNNNNATGPLPATNSTNYLHKHTIEEMYQKQFAQQSTAVDFYSIRQFGLDTMLTDRLPMPNAPNINNTATIISAQSQQLKQQQEQVSNSITAMLSPNSYEERQENNVASLSISQQQPQQHINTIKDTAPNAFAPSTPSLSSPSTLFEISDFSYPFFYGASVTNNSNNITSTTSSTDNYNATSSATADTYYDNQSAVNPTSVDNNLNDPSAVFMFRMDNPFWGIPNSMEVDDWQAYLLPHQHHLEQRRGSSQQ